MFRTRYNKNKRICVPCVPSCVSLSTNGTQTQALPHKLLTIFVYHVYHCARTRIRENFSYLYIFIISKVFKHFEKVSRVINIILMVHIVHIYLKALCSKVFTCVPLNTNPTQKTSFKNIAFQVIDFKIYNLCTIGFGSFNLEKEQF